LVNYHDFNESLFLIDKCKNQKDLKSRSLYTLATKTVLCYFNHTCNTDTVIMVYHRQIRI